jgi:luciferase family oxidoreductase group 1
VDLSVLDFQHPGHAVEMAALADALGYRRYWLGEHHTGSQCANPLLLGALLAATTSGGLRIGSGGVCLRYNSPARVAEDARLIEFLLPGRFDLGVARGLQALDPALHRALADGRPDESPDGFGARLLELHGWVTGRFPAEHPLHGAMANVDPGPPIWVLGRKPGSAELAARCGSGFCFSLHHGSTEDGIESFKAYRRGFEASAEFDAPAVIVVVSGVCAASEADAQRAFARQLERQQPEARDRTAKPSIVVGSPERWADALDVVAERFDADEIMVLDLLPGEPERRVEMYQLLAERFELSPRGSPESGEPAGIATAER